MPDAGGYEKYLKNLPVMPEVATKIMGLAEDGLDISFKDLENIIKVDPGLTAKILKVANSAMYARQREISNLQNAITLLGFKNIKSLVMLVTASNMFRDLRGARFYQTFWRHSVNTAFIARHLSARLGQKEIADESFVGGLLHDIGQSAFYNAGRESYERLLETAQGTGRRIEELETDAFGLDHHAVGAALLEKWFFPDLYVDIAREHGGANITSRHKAVILTVAVADLLAEIMGRGFGEPGAEQLLGEMRRHLGLAETDIDYYKGGFTKDIAEDTLYRECQELFGLKE